MAKEVSIADMDSGTTGVISRVQGGAGLGRNLENMGIRPGVKIRKVSQQIMSGPVIIQAGNTQLALGRGMAKKVFVEVP